MHVFAFIHRLRTGFFYAYHRLAVRVRARYGLSFRRFIRGL
jgi:hypothetical protein